MKKFISIFLCVIMAALLLGACGKEEPEPEKTNDTAVIGTWEEDYFDSGYIFNADGTGTDTFWDLTFTYTAYDGELTLIYDDELWGASVYSYTISSDKLTMTRNDSEGSETFEYIKASSQSQAPAATTAAETEAESETEAD